MAPIRATAAAVARRRRRSTTVDDVFSELFVPVHCSRIYFQPQFKDDLKTAQQQRNCLLDRALQAIAPTVRTLLPFRHVEFSVHTHNIWNDTCMGTLYMLHRRPSARIAYAALCCKPINQDQSKLFLKWPKWHSHCKHH